MSNFGKVFGLYIFLLIDLILLAIFVGLEPHPSRIIFFSVDIVEFYLSPSTWFFIAIGIILQILLVIYLAIRAIGKERKIQFYPEYLGVEADSRLGKYTPKDLQDLVKDLEKKTGHHVKKGYLGVEVLPKIISHYIPGSSNRLYLNSNLLQICGKEELTAALGIEFKSFNSFNNTLITFLNYHSRAFMLVLFLRLFYPLIISVVYLVLEVNGYAFDLQTFTAMGFVFVASLIITFVLWQIMNYFIKSAYLNSHYTSDKEAAELVGKNTTINMLVKLGQRSESLDVLLEEIKWLEEKRIGKIYEFDEEKLKELLEFFPQNEISEHVAREKAPEIFLKNRFSHLTGFYHVNIPNLDSVIKDATNKLLDERKNYIDERKVKLEEMGKKLPQDETIDWRKFDVDGNLHLDDKEIEEFVLELKSSKKLLFENELVGDAFFRRRPPINKRIIRLSKLKLENTD
ncbi:MAG: hypothetical protein HeimC3_01980 [Candidatus Heimdallarchaeota archaeon LC_3]|nr:MAG: hypothetical protein HeimC3_01980 [Candidatus Heimdallarchaeota archaeon LC_3]